MARPGGEVTGTIYSIGETQQVTERFRKRVLVLTFGDNPKYPQHVEFQTVGDRCESLLQGFAEGQIVTLHYNLGGRLRKNGDGCFNALEIWKIDERGSAAPPASRPQTTSRSAEPPPPPIDDDIPF